MPKFTANITGVSTYHCGQADGEDSTTVSLAIEQKDINHWMSAPRFEISGPAKEMTRFVHAHKSCQAKQKKAKAFITIDLDEPEENEIQVPAPSLFPFLNDTLLTLVLTT